MFLKRNVVLTPLQFLFFVQLVITAQGACELDRQETQILICEGPEMSYGSMIWFDYHNQWTGEVVRVKLVREIVDKYAPTLCVTSGLHIISYKHSSDGNL
jgi:hypothetical protein